MCVAFLLAAPASSEDMRLFLFVLVMIAVALILTGGTIAMLVFVGQRKARNSAVEENLHV